MYKIRGIRSQRKFFNSINLNVFGLAVYPFNRLYLNNILKNYTILSLRESQETPFIRKDVNVISIESTLNKSLAGLKKNANTIVKDENIKELLKSKENVYLLSYKGRKQLEDLCLENKWVSAVGSSSLGKKLLEDKNKFREFISQKGFERFFPKYKILSIDSLNYDELCLEISPKLVIQYPTSGGGKGTFFINDKESFENAVNVMIEKFSIEDKNQRIVVSEFINGVSLSTSGIATKWGTFSSNLQAQIIDIEEIAPQDKGNGIFCGHDWSLANKIPKRVHNQAIEITKTVGELIYQLGYKGFFGIDMMYDQENKGIYIIECNPRFTGVMPTLDLIQSSKNRTQFSTVHLLEYITDNELNGEVKLNSKFIQKELSKKKEGSHFFLSSKFWEEKSIHFLIKPGVYRLKGDSIKFIKEGYKYSDLKRKNDFLFTEIPSKNINIKGYGRLARVITKQGVLKNYREMNDFGKRITTLLYNQIEFKEPNIENESYNED